MKKLTDKQKKNLDKTGDGKISKEDFLLLRRLKKKKNGKAQSQSDENSEETFRASFKKTHGYDEEANA